jgi:hypothetical protein
MFIQYMGSLLVPGSSLCLARDGLFWEGWGFLFAACWYANSSKKEKRLLICITDLRGVFGPAKHPLD